MSKNIGARRLRKQKRKAHSNALNAKRAGGSKPSAKPKPK